MAVTLWFKLGKDHGYGKIEKVMIKVRQQNHSSVWLGKSFLG